jgi:hypothetical protein
MRRGFARWVVVVVGVASLACSGLGGGADPGSAEDAGYGSVAFQTYEADGGRYRIQFVSDTHVRKTWRNMNGDPVGGDYTQTGADIAVTYDPAAEHHGSLSERFRQMGPCSLARYERVDRDGVVHEDPNIFERTEPVCDAVRLVP